MSPLAQPALVPIGENRWRLTEDYTYEWLYGGVFRRITVKAGFETDLASVPPLFWALGFPPDGLHRAASVVHDALYKARGALPSGDATYQETRKWIEPRDWSYLPARYTREEADRLFGRMMRDAGVPKWRRDTMYRAVRLCSWLFW